MTRCFPAALATPTKTPIVCQCATAKRSDRTDRDLGRSYEGRGGHICLDTTAVRLSASGSMADRSQARGERFLL